jgi:hypothetical protein
MKETQYEFQRTKKEMGSTAAVDMLFHRIREEEIDRFSGSRKDDNFLFSFFIR